MEKFEALADLVRTLSKRCEEFEYYKRQAETYRRWYEEEQEKCEKLKDEINRLSG